MWRPSWPGQVGPVLGTPTFTRLDVIKGLALLQARRPLNWQLPRRHVPLMTTALEGEKNLS